MLNKDMLIELFDSLAERIEHSQSMQEEKFQDRIDNVNAFAAVVDCGIYTWSQSVVRQLISEKFCVGCMYRHLDTIRKGITRYLSTETVINPDYRESFLKMSEICNKFCIYFKQEFTVQISLRECELIKNPAYEELVSRFMDKENDLEEEEEI